MHKNSIHNQVFNRITKNKRGKIFFPSDFNEIGSDDAVRKSLIRLEQEDVLERLSPGIYLYPKKDPVFGNLYPSTEEIAQYIAKRDHAKIIPTGVTALHKLKLSTQVPMNIVYLTDGAPRKIKIGKQKITFKPTTAKKLATKGEISTLVIQALQEIGKNGVNTEILRHLKPILKQEDLKNIRHDTNLAPVWIANILNYLTKSEDNDELA